MRRYAEWKFPDLEKNLFFPDFWLTRGNPINKDYNSKRFSIGIDPWPTAGNCMHVARTAVHLPFLIILSLFLFSFGDVAYVKNKITAVIALWTNCGLSN